MTTPAAHPSAGWQHRLRPHVDGYPADPERFAELMRHEAYPRASAYDPAWVQQNQMGPHVVWLTDALTQAITIEPGMRVLDLGCGAAMSSVFVAREFGATVFAADVWIPASDNGRRVEQAGLGDRVFPCYAEARSLPFPEQFFDVVMSVDSYHYFGTDLRYLSYLARFVRPGGVIAIVVPGNSTDPDDLPVDVAAEGRAQHGADYFTFRSAAWWGRHWSRATEVDVERAEMIPGGWDLWMRHTEASAAWSGEPVEQTGDAGLLLSDAGRTLGFVLAVCRRTASEPLQLGPGEWQRRLA